MAKTEKQSKQEPPIQETVMEKSPEEKAPDQAPKEQVAKKTGQCKVLKINFFLPDGATPELGQEFDPMTVKMSLARYQSLVSRRYITSACESIENKMQVEWARKAEEQKVQKG